MWGLVGRLKGTEGREEASGVGLVDAGQHGPAGTRGGTYVGPARALLEHAADAPFSQPQLQSLPVIGVQPRQAIDLFDEEDVPWAGICDA